MPKVRIYNHDQLVQEQEFGSEAAAQADIDSKLSESYMLGPWSFSADPDIWTCEANDIEIHLITS